MKREVKRISPIASGALKTLGMALVCLLFAMCGSKNSSPEEVARRIDAKEALSQDDYRTIIDYCGEYAKTAQQYFDIIDSQASESTPEAVKAAADLAAVYGKYKYIDMFRNALFNVDESQLDARNVKNVKEYSGYEAFPLPGGAGEALEDPDVVGDIEQMPASDTSGVISQGDGEAVDIQVKE